MEDLEVAILPKEAEITSQQIKDMIAKLSQTEAGEPLANAMNELKVALKKNPTACALLLPEEIGECVKYIMQITGRDLELQASGKKREKKEKFDFTDPDTLKALEDDLF